MLKNRQLEGRRFQRQHCAGPYILDFTCMPERLAIELDGEPHAHPPRRDDDLVREQALVGHGIRVIRFENHLVCEQPDIVLAAIASCFGSPPEDGGSPRGAGEGGAV